MNRLYIGFKILVASNARSHGPCIPECGSTGAPTEREPVLGGGGDRARLLDAAEATAPDADGAAGAAGQGDNVVDAADKIFHDMVFEEIFHDMVCQKEFFLSFFSILYFFFPYYCCKNGLRFVFGSVVRLPSESMFIFILSYLYLASFSTLS